VDCGFSFIQQSLPNRWQFFNCIVAAKSAHAAFIGSADSTNLPASVDGNATTARFSYPTDITIDSVGNLYVTDSGTEKVRRITTNGIVTTLGGSPDGFFYNPLAVAAGANGLLYVADAGNNRIARGLPGSAAIQPPVITSQPSSFENVYGNTTVTFSVSATGSGLKYQWYRNGAAVSRASTPILSLKTSTATQGVYTVVVSNTLGTVVSEPASLSLRPPADWTWGNEVPSQPALPGDTVIFSVVDVQGPGTIRYQWLKNGVAIRGKTGLSLQLDNVSIADSGVYALSITTSAGTILTESQTLHVEDTGTLVYKISANGSVATGANRTTAKLEGYLVRDRSAGDSCFVWANPAGKTLIVDPRPELIMKSTGPVVGSTSVLRSYLQELDDEESIWLSGIDNLVMVSPKTTPRGRSPSLPAQKTWVLAPQSLEGHLNTITNDGSTIIEMLRATLTLDTAQTLKAIKEDGGFDSTIDRLKTELEAKGYQQSEN
jgi:hypothetical protein